MTRFRAVLLAVLLLLSAGAAARAEDGRNPLDAAAATISDPGSSAEARAAAESALRNARRTALDRILGLVKSGNWNARATGLRLAAEAGAADLPALLREGLSDPNWAVREQAAKLAGTLPAAGRGAAEAALRRLLDDPITRVRIAAYTALAAWNPNGPAVSEALLDDDEDVCAWAAQQYVKRPQPGLLSAESRAKLIEKLVVRFRNSGWSDMDAASLVVLFSLGTSARDILSEVILSAGSEERRTAIQNIGERAGAAAADLFFQFVEDDDPRTRLAAVSAICDACDVRHAPRLLDMLKGSYDPYTAGRVAAALGRLQYKPAIPRLLQLADSSGDVQMQAARALAQMQDKSLAPHLIRICRRRSRSDLIEPIAALLGRDGGAFLDELAGDSDRGVRYRAAAAAAQYLDATAAVDLLVRMLREEDDESVRGMIVASLARVQPNAEQGARVGAALVDVLRDGGSGSRQTAIAALAQMRPPGAARALVELIERDQDPELQDTVMQALARFDDREAVAALRAALESPDAWVRRAALAAMGQSADKLSDDALMRLTRKEDDPLVLRTCAALLAARRIADASLLPRLVKLLDGADDALRGDILACIARIGGVQAFQILCKEVKENGNPALRAAVAEGVVTSLASGRIRAAEVTASLSQALECPDAETRARLVSMLAGLADRGLAPLLLKVLKTDAAEEVRAAAAQGVRRIARPEFVPQILDAAKAEQKAENVVALIGMLGELQDRRALPFLRECLRAAEPAVQAAALLAIGPFKDASLVPFYAERFQQSSSTEVRLSCIRNILGSGDRRTLDVLQIAAKDPSPPIRDCGLQGLAEFCDAEAAGTLAARLAAPETSDGVAETIIKALAWSRSRTAADKLLEAARGAGVPAVRVRVLRALGEIGDQRAVAVLAEALRKNESAELSEAALAALAALDARSEAPLCLKMAKAVPGRLSYAAAATAIRLGAGPAAADLLIARFREGTEAQKQVCAEALAWSDAPGAQRLLIDTLAGAGDASLLASACRSLKAGTQDGPAALRGVALSDVGEEAEVAAVERLSPRTEDEDALREIVRSGRRVRVRAAALVRLAQNLPAATGSAARKAEVSALIAEALRSPEPDLKQGAARAAALLGSPTLAEDAAVLLVELAGRSEDRALQMEAVRALGTVRGNKAAEDRLTALLSVSDDAVLLAEVARSLGELRCAAAVPKLAELAASGAVSCRVEAVGALGGIHSPAAMEAVELAFRQNIVDRVRAAAARALGASGDRKHVPTLAEALRSAPGLDVRAACAEALGMLGGESARAPLVEALRQDSALVRESAVRSLGRVDARDAGAAIAALCEDSDVRTAAAAREVTARWTKGQ